MSRRADDSDIARRARMSRPGVVAELWAFIRANKKWWLLPILFVILLLGALVFLTGSGAAPFIYTLF
jgi:Family of unknown function (DUF5989)